MHPEYANLAASLHRDELLREAEAERRSNLARRSRPRRLGRLLAARNAVGYQLVRLGLHLVVAPPSTVR